jgi:hypothetical protein
MLKDDFTEKYYQEDNPHNKELFNPSRVSVGKKTKIQSTLSRSQAGIQEEEKRQKLN